MENNLTKKEIEKIISENFEINSNSEYYIGPMGFGRFYKLGKGAYGNKAAYEMICKEIQKQTAESIKITLEEAIEAGESKRNKYNKQKKSKYIS
jgi:hypothetical protein